MITLQHISKTYYKGQSNEVKALQPLSLEINQGDFVIIVGANGSGKTTLLNLISGEISPSEGKILIHQQEIQTLPDDKRSKWIAKVFQNPLSGTAADLTVIENFRLAALRAQSKKLKMGIDAAFIQRVKNEIATLGMGLEDKIYQKMGSLSGGQRQALTLLMCKMDELSILLLDEPTAALDPRSANKILQIAKQMNETKQLTTLLVTHNLKDAFEYGNRLIQMEDGKIRRDLTTYEKQNITQNEIFTWFA